MLKLGVFQAIIVQSHRLLQSTHIAFLILLLTLHIFLPASIFAECIYGNCTNGHGTYTWSNGQKYVGEFRDGKANGQGIYTWPNGQKYIGEFRDNKSDGQGIYTWPDGQKYVGEFRDDKSDGQGIYTWPNGQKYVGEFRDDKPTVNGTLTTPTNWYVVFGGIFFFIAVTLIFLWYRNTANNNQKDNFNSTSGFSSKEDYETSKLSKMNQKKNIYQNKNVFKEVDMTKNSGQQSLENDDEINRCYQVLQLRPGVSKEEVRGAYKNLLIVWDAHKHTDYPTLQKKAQETIKEIDEAYEKLLLHMAAESSAAKQISSDLKAVRQPD